MLMAVACDHSKLGQHNFVRGGILRGLGYQRDAQIYKYLQKRVTATNEADKEPFRYARPCAVKALAVCAFWQDSVAARRETIDILESIVSRGVEDEACRNAAVDGLILL